MARRGGDARPEAARLVDVDERGWTAVPGVLDPTAAVALAATCTAVLAGRGDDVRVGDKAASGTRRLVDLAERVPEVAGVLVHPEVVAIVEHVIGPGASPQEVTFRSPGPGFGEQRLHADDVPLVGGDPWRVATAIVALCELTEENGATGVVPGSHRRPDLQRRSGSLEQHDDEVVLTGPAGTAFVLNGHVLHRGRRNRSSAPRPVLQITWRREGGLGVPAPRSVG